MTSSSAQLDPFRLPDEPTGPRPPLWDEAQTPKETARDLAIAWASLDRHRSAPKKPDALYRATTGCAVGCSACDFRCSLMTAGVYRLWQAHQRALAESGGVLIHEGHVFSVPVGRA